MPSSIRRRGELAVRQACLIDAGTGEALRGSKGEPGTENRTGGDAPLLAEMASGDADRRAGRALRLHDIERNGLRHLALNRHLYFVAASLGELNRSIDGYDGGLISAWSQTGWSTHL